MAQTQQHHSAVRHLLRSALSDTRAVVRALLAWAFLVLARKAFRVLRAKRALQVSGKGKTAVVTGGASGVGRSTVELLARQGWRVYCVDINEANLATVDRDLREQAGLDVRTARTNVTSLESCEALRDRVTEELKSDADRPGLDLLINCAAVAFVGPVLSCPWTQIETQMQVNLMGPIRMCTAFKDALLASAHSSAIVNVGSISGCTAWPWQCAYSSTKAGLLGFAETLRREIVASGRRLRVHTINPGPIDTPLVAAQSEAGKLWLSENANDTFADAMAATDARHDGAMSIKNRWVFLGPDDVAKALVAVANDPLSPSVSTVVAPLFWPIYSLLLTLPESWGDALMTTNL
ncbi:3-hydroxybutyrate dehydrogenase type 2 [Hondaea fermentalgiana]|uniref:3-hydroxybutyrate dehydrogenase type 2 n=1 Tax=Hondaea fermentalgiana TaxID=2315210 RepID=A0A2R5GV49_9STRA|nr:3-hydroxybutyrate dehydrogenase type 2 [Hondaea fermentalgiana]|eukprot:GBG34199.1 3-hydroxybutyrate dehydrogenase type 2 [Hondaea fermentalgiana]